MLLRGVHDLCRIDPDLAEVVRRHGPPPLWGRQPGFATLLRIILEQQVSLASGRAVYRRIEGEIGRINVQTVLGAGTRGLRALGVTRQKASCWIEVARAADDGRLNLRRLGQSDDEQARAELMDIKGIGPWTANVYLLMALRRPDIWPPGDVALLTALQHLRKSKARPSNEEALVEAESWRPWRAVAARILWHGYLSGSLTNTSRRTQKPGQ